LLLAVPATARQVSVEVSPLRVELAAAPGSTTTQAVTLTNAGTEPVRVRGTLTDWDLSRDGAPQFEGAAEDGPFSSTAWVRIAPPEQVIEPGKEATVRFSLTVPPDAAAGGYRTGILFDFAPASGDPLARGRQVTFRSRIATLIYVNVGQPPLAADLIDLAVRTVGPQIRVVATLKNTSRRYVRTKGTLLIYDRSGKVVREMPLPDAPLLPESEREIAIAPVDPEKKLSLPPGEYRVEIKIDLGLPALLVGETTLKVPG
jgi:P pilus assembly chaperone PapD